MAVQVAMTNRMNARIPVRGARIPIGLVRYLAYAWGLTLLVAALTPAWADGPVPGKEAARVVRAGLLLRSITALDDGNRTFDADFDLWLRSSGTFDSAGLFFPDAVKPVVIGTPVAGLDRDADHYRLYRLQATFRYRVDKAALVHERRALSIRVGLGGHGTSDLLLVPDPASLGGMAGTGTMWIDQLRAADVLGGLNGWSLLSADFAAATHRSSALGDPRYPSGVLERPTVIATIGVGRDLASPRGVLDAVYQAPASPLPFLLALILLGVSLVPQSRRLGARLRVASRLLLGTAVCYFAEPLLTGAAADRLSLAGLEQLLIALRCAWWIAPAIWAQSLLPALVWDPLGRRSGHPIPSITRTLVPAVGYAFATLLILRFVFGQSLTAVWAASGVLTLVLGLALQSLILDAFAGLMLNLEQPFKILQWISLESGLGARQVGQVLEMNWRATRLLTRSNDLLSIPNSKIAQSYITNYALPSSSSRLEFYLVLDETVPIRLAQRLIKEGVLAAAEQGRLLTEPQPRVVLESSSEHGIRYKVQFFVNLALVSDGTAISDAIEGAIARLTREGIQVAGQLPPDGPSRDSKSAPANRSADVVQPGLIGVPTELALAAAPESRPAPITPEQVKLVQGSWAKVVPIADTAAKLFYQRLFMLDPALRPMFRTDAHAQRVKLVGMLGLAVKGLSRLDGLLSTLQDLGMRHVTYGVEDRHYDTVGEALLWTLEKGLGAEFTIEVKAAWVQAYSLLAATMKSAK